MAATKHQNKMYNTCINQGFFQFPCCGAQIAGNWPDIENEDDFLQDDKTQIYCYYCRMYIYIEDYK